MKRTNLFLIFAFVFMVNVVGAMAYDGQPYWIEHDENGNPQNNIWIKGNWSGSTDFYVYYNGDISYSNGNDVFDFFDDFDGSSLDTGKWEPVSISPLDSGEYSIFDSKIVGSDSSKWNEMWTIKNNLPNNLVATALLKFATIRNEFSFYINEIESNEGRFGMTVESNGDNYITYVDSGGNYKYTQDNGFIVENQWQKATIKHFNNEVDFYTTSGGYWKTFTDAKEVFSSVRILFALGEMSVDWVFVRKYASSEPSVSYGSEETGSWELMGTTFTKRRKVTVTSSEPLSDYQIALDYYMFNSTNLYISLETYDVNLNQTLNYDEPKVNHNVTQQCYWYNASEQPSSVNITLEAINTNDSTTLYSQTFENVNENETVSYQYTIQNTDAHDSIQFKCIYEDAEGNSKETATTLTVENTEPTQPTTITIDPTEVFVNTTITATASGSSDIDGDSITYEYKFYNVNDDLVVQNWSTTNNYTVQVSDAHDVIRVYARAYDGYNYSTESYSDTNVLNTNPTITNLTITEPVISTENTIVNLSISDLDNDTSFTVRVYANDYTHLIDTINNYNSTQLNIIVPESYANQNVTFLFNVSDAYSGSDEANQSKFVYWAKLIPNYFDEKTHEPLNLSAISSSKYTITFDDGTTKEYDFTNESLIEKPVNYVTFNAQYDTYNEFRVRRLNAGLNNLSIYFIDLTTTPWVLTTFYVLGVDEGYLELYTSDEGIISTQKLDVSQSAEMYMIQNKEYQVRLLYDDTVKELGHVVRSTSSTIQLQFSEVVPTITNVRSNIVWGAEFITNSLLRVYYNDSDRLTSKVCVRVRDSESIVYSSCIEGYSEAMWSDVNINSSKTYEVKLTITKSGETWDEIKYFRYGREVATPVDIPEWFLKFGSVAILIIVAVTGTVLNAHIVLMLDLILASLFVYFGWISLPVPLLAILSLIAIFTLIKRGE